MHTSHQHILGTVRANTINIPIEPEVYKKSRKKSKDKKRRLDTPTPHDFKSFDLDLRKDDDVNAVTIDEEVQEQHDFEPEPEVVELRPKQPPSKPPRTFVASEPDLESNFLESSNISSTVADDQNESGESQSRGQPEEADVQAGPRSVEVADQPRPDAVDLEDAQHGGEQRVLDQEEPEYATIKPKKPKKKKSKKHKKKKADQINDDNAKPLNPRALTTNKSDDQPTLNPRATMNEERKPSLVKTQKSQDDNIPVFRMAPASTANVPGTGGSGSKPKLTKGTPVDHEEALNQNDDNKDEDLLENLEIFSPDYVEPIKVKPKLHPKPKPNPVKKSSPDPGKLTKEEEEVLEKAAREKAEQEREAEQDRLEKQRKISARRAMMKEVEEKERLRLARTRELKVEKDLKAKAMKIEATEAKTEQELRNQLKLVTADSQNNPESQFKKRVMDDLVIDEDDDLLPIRRNRGSRSRSPSPSASSSSRSRSPSPKAESGLVAAKLKGMLHEK